MKSSVTNKCKDIVSEVNRVFYERFNKNVLDIKFNSEGFDIVASDRNICHVCDVCINPELVEVCVSEEMKLEFGMYKDEKIICNSSTLPVILRDIIFTEYAFGIIIDGGMKK